MSAWQLLVADMGGGQRNKMKQRRVEVNGRKRRDTAHDVKEGFVRNTHQPQPHLSLPVIRKRVYTFAGLVCRGSHNVDYSNHN